MLRLFPAAHTHTHSDTHTLLRLSCGNRPCPCKSWLRVINQASTFVWFDWTATVCHRKRPKALRVYMSYIYKYACITILLFDRKPKQQQCCLTFQCFSPFCKWDVFDFLLNQANNLKTFIQARRTFVGHFRVAWYLLDLSVSRFVKLITKII